VIGAISMDSFAVELGDEVPLRTPVTLVGRGVTLEDHAHVTGTINYELAVGISSDPRRTRRTVTDS
jgi:alanine racemase